ncbi:hypothetical protein THAOC_08395 [Thalassiosira oceanica]|uniref:Uncharacterized protein n=1 Tax=Thalassiosira oceanica TaxID=159749 RepID=K0SV55_THAOC|nr:hypothetical protein THAOC_08395 [Thalassiosira oceanica]|eukprot:EJK70258.1 hypothetical protein THAOC_08395 [Thalassiosira oceanica]
MGSARNGASDGGSASWLFLRRSIGDFTSRTKSFSKQAIEMLNKNTAFFCIPSVEDGGAGGQEEETPSPGSVESAERGGRRGPPGEGGRRAGSSPNGRDASEPVLPRGARRVGSSDAAGRTAKRAFVDLLDEFRSPKLARKKKRAETSALDESKPRESRRDTLACRRGFSRGRGQWSPRPGGDHEYTSHRPYAGARPNRGVGRGTVARASPPCGIAADGAVPRWTERSGRSKAAHPGATITSRIPWGGRGRERCPDDSAIDSSSPKTAVVPSWGGGGETRTVDPRTPRNNVDAERSFFLRETPPPPGRRERRGASCRPDAKRPPPRDDDHILLNASLNDTKHDNE